MIRLLNKQDFLQIWRIMEQSFPADERRPREEQLALFDDPIYRVYGSTDENGALIAFLAVWELDSVVFLEHFAVDPARRNGGIGGSMLREVIGTLGKTACLEVELPETELARRRIGFYERNGFYFYDYPYLQPPLSKGQGTVPLRIMTTEKNVSFSEFSEIKHMLYDRVYQYREN